MFINELKEFKKKVIEDRKKESAKKLEKQGPPKNNRVEERVRDMYIKDFKRMVLKCVEKNETYLDLPLDFDDFDDKYPKEDVDIHGIMLIWLSGPPYYEITITNDYCWYRLLEQWLRDNGFIVENSNFLHTDTAITIYIDHWGDHPTTCTMRVKWKI